MRPWPRKVGVSDLWTNEKEGTLTVTAEFQGINHLV